MSLRQTSLLKKSLFLASERYLGGLELYRSLQDNAASSRDVVLAQQRGRLSSLLQHASKHVPYYEGVLADIGADVDRIDEIPLLDKNILREQFDALTSDDHSRRKSFVNMSGGSTGEPTRFIQDQACKDWIRAIRMLFDVWSGCPFGARKLFVWGSERDLFVGRETLKVNLKRWIKNERWVNAFKMSPENMRRHVEEINAFKPLHIQAYAASLDELASFIEKEDLEVFAPASILTSAGTLYPYMRERIARVFRAPVFNRYGSREVGDIACQWNSDGDLLVSDFTHYVEILRKDGSAVDPGEMGEVVVTYLVNYSMPLIRYRIGDMAIRAKTSGDGPAWTRLERVVGRVTDVFRKPDSGVVSAEFFIHLIGVVLNTGWIRKYQVIQEALDRITIKVVSEISEDATRTEHAAALAEIRSSIQKVMGADCNVDFDFVEDIPPSPSGKYLYTISKLKDRNIPAT